jgi:hypothetical protein
MRPRRDLDRPRQTSTDLDRPRQASTDLDETSTGLSTSLHTHWIRLGPMAEHDSSPDTASTRQAHRRDPRKPRQQFTDQQMRVMLEAQWPLVTDEFFARQWGVTRGAVGKARSLTNNNKRRPHVITVIRSGIFGADRHAPPGTRPQHGERRRNLGPQRPPRGRAGGGSAVYRRTISRAV